jgi:hypothetical protein
VSESSPSNPFRFGAFVIGWVFPGLGHIVSGNAKRGLYAMAGVLTLFISGLLVGGVDCVDRREDALWFLGQAGAGPIAFGASYANDAFLKSGSAAPMIEMPSYPGAPKITVSSFKGVGHSNDFGTLLVFLAGLLNICVMLDAGTREPSSDHPTSGRRAGDGGPRKGAPAASTAPSATTSTTSTTPSSSTGGS